MNTAASPTDEFLARRFIELRTAAGLSRAAVAELSGLTDERLASIESGKERIDAAVMARLAAAMATTVLDVFGISSTARGQLAGQHDDLRLACVDELMEVDDAVVFRLVLSLLWVLREEGQSGLELLAKLARQPRPRSN